MVVIKTVSRDRLKKVEEFFEKVSGLVNRAYAKDSLMVYFPSSNRAFIYVAEEDKESVLFRIGYFLKLIPAPEKILAPVKLKYLVNLLYLYSGSVRFYDEKA